MRKSVIMMAFLALSATGMAQDVDNFEVGPYEVEYKEPGDYKFRLRKDVELYDYFGLRKDTTIQVAEATSRPVKGAFLLNVSMSMPRWAPNGTSNTFGIDGAWKLRIGRKVYLNMGLVVALSTGKYGAYWKNHTKDWAGSNFNNYTETIFEVGVPLSVEYANIDYKRASLYGGVGVVPTFYTGAKKRGGGTVSGLFFAPRLDLGGYVPVGGKLVRVGAFTQYDINCTPGEYDVFARRIGRFVVGFNFGLVF